ncbi:hypothetical protein [Aeromonas veronii]|uniref:hypothetical protein n=1 Tax=Aeromonas veronii TaxID=654 RepID=UPI003D1BAD8B
MEHLVPSAAHPMVLLVDDKSGCHKLMNALLGECLLLHVFSCEAVLMMVRQNDGACCQP